MRDPCPFESRVLSTIQKHHLLDGVVHLLVAASGGADSTALLHSIYRLKTRLGLHRLTVVHFDHRLRGEDSSEDARFVQGIAERLGLECLMGSEDVLRHQRSHRVSLEMAARACRHQFFQDAMAGCGADALATGHTANDQAEEVLLRLFRGTGPSGLAGMRPKERRGIIRPLLFVTRREVLDYLHSHGLPFREDPSNFQAICRRNVLRREVMPLLEKHFHPAVVRTLCRGAELSRDEEAYWGVLVEERWDEVCQARTPSVVHLRLAPLGDLDTALQRRVLRHAIALLKGNLQRIEACHIDAALRLAFHSTSGKSFQLPERIGVSKEGSLLVVSRDMGPGRTFDAPQIVVSKPGVYGFGDRVLRFSLVDRAALQEVADHSRSPLCACLDAAKVAWPLFLRHWQPGDRFQPLGLRGTKKLQDFFVDSKIPRSMRQEIIIVCDTEKICWIVGHRLDERAKVMGETGVLLVIEVET
jgi:tRNA(Ile)-lysidine synthase